MNIDPKQLKYRVQLLRPTDAKTKTGNTKGEFSVYATRYAGRISGEGSDTVSNDQNVATNSVTWLVRYDSAVKPSWVVRFDSADYYIESVVDDDDGAKRYLRLRTTKRETIAPLADPLDPPVLTLGAVGASAVALSWTASTGATGYRVYVDGVLFATISATSFVVAGLDSATDFEFYVEAFNSYTESDPSNTVEATTLEAASLGYFGQYFGGSAI